MVALALEGRAIGDCKQRLGLIAGEPVSKPGSLFRGIRNIGEVCSLLRPKHPVASCFGDQLAQR